MRISFIGTRGVPATYSGFETCVENVGARMAERGHEVTVYCRSGHYDHHLAQHRGMKLRYRPAVPQKHLETLSHSLLSVLSLDRKSAVVCMGVGNLPAVRFLEGRGRRVVFNVDGADWQRGRWGGVARRYLRWCERAAARGMSIIVADATTVVDYYAVEYKRESELIPYGASPPADTGFDAPVALGVRPGSYILFVGRLVPENGAHDFLDGMVKSATASTGVVVGSASYEDAYISSLKRQAPTGTVFAGYQFGSAYQQLSSHARLFVMAASVGGTHPVLLEQMAAGNCVLARDTPSHREVLRDTGLYWKDSDGLGVLLRELSTDNERALRLGAAAKRRVEEVYNWELVTSQYLTLCEQTLA